jgi:hypothetical protein
MTDMLREMVMGYPSFIENVDGTGVKGIGSVDGGEANSIESARERNAAASSKAIVRGPIRYAA